jgi:23S rRNA (uracil1939-C5)-methyltransferase
MATDCPTIELSPSGMASDGRAIARDPEGKVVFVEGALPGEKVAAEMQSEHRGYSTARVVDVVEASPDRVVPPCPEHARGCGGCPWQHVDPPAQRSLKRQIISDSIKRIGRIEPPEITEADALPVWEYRTTLRAGVTGGRAALRRQRSSDLVSIERCMVIHPLLGELVRGVRYGGASEVVLRCGARTGDRLVATRPTSAEVEIPSDVSRRRLFEEVAGHGWRVSARSFFQSRPDGADLLAGLVQSGASAFDVPGEALDLYSGVGMFAGALAELGWSVTAVEGSHAAVQDARDNLAGLPVSVVRSDVARFRARPADLVVADPSRDGLGPGGVATVVQSGAQRVILISCDAASLGRDLGLLAARGYRLLSVTAVDLFPHTFRIEAVSLLERAT